MTGGVDRLEMHEWLKSNVQMNVRLNEDNRKYLDVVGVLVVVGRLEDHLGVSAGSRCHRVEGKRPSRR